MITRGDFEGRRAPYAPISALQRFFERIRDRSVPDHVDHRFLERLNVASNNEYALLSALKFLGIVDDRGVPTHAYRRLQTTDSFRDTLRHLVETAYRPVFEQGAHTWNADDLVNFFRVSSSPSQAKNAARFFRAVCDLAGIEEGDEPMQEVREELPVDLPPRSQQSIAEQPAAPQVIAQGPVQVQRSAPTPAEDVLRARIALAQKLPAPHEGWSAEDYRAICESFATIIQSLQTTS